MYRTQPQRRSTAWTRLTGSLFMVAAYATLVVGVLPLPPDPDVRDLRLALFGCTLMCVLMWIMASVRSPRTDAVILDKAEQRERRPSRSLPILLAFAVPLASGAALVQAVGPDGEQGRWVSKVYAAGGGTYEIPIDKVLTEPHPTGVNINDVDEYAADVMVTLQFDAGARSVTVHGARTVGKPVKGDTVAIMYAPGRPGLGVRHNDSGFFSSGFALIWIWALTFFVGIFTAGIFAMSRDTIHSARRFSTDVHGAATLVLCLGVSLLLPGQFFYTSTWSGWLLALAAASTPWLALTWVLKRM
ncbi:hypothetical protein OHB05_02100 [Streptomyces sp. NBC_00638]|uniref:hypothetical protein n=1 Tax=unclassified Streptomyces TaxID=2593676 RepID=UPI00225C1BFA|nr:hypothetical protein [Streptomyces sp. NBC_00638]MCX5001424.1 hypothetical protein [Streptomyces sp. NBC_00638]